MNPLPDPREQILLGLLAGGPQKAADLTRALGVSQPTLSRIVRSLGTQVIKLGAARGTLHARPRRIAEEIRWPLYRITPDAKIESCGEVIALMGIPSCWHRSPWADQDYSDGLPFFIQDLRPQGFMGKHIPATVPELGLPPRIQDWTDDHVLRYLVLHGHDAVGDLVLGNRSLQALQVQRAQDHAEQVRVAADAREKEFERLATAAIGGLPAGSSAGGEQPKFSANVEGVGWTLVKFSPPDDGESSHRWRDLLLAEFHALATLNRHGVRAAQAALIDGPERRFLQVTRFDRHADYGRSSLISLGALNNEFVGMVDSWTNTAAALAEKKLIAAEEVERVRLIETVAMLIGNSDRHNGNLSFSATYAASPQFPFALAPCYDMLPMHYAPPAAAETRPYTPLAVAAPGPEGPEIWLEAANIAVEFWNRVGADPRATDAFRAVSSQNATNIEKYRSMTLGSWSAAAR